MGIVAISRSVRQMVTHTGLRRGSVGTPTVSTEIPASDQIVCNSAFQQIAIAYFGLKPASIKTFHPSYLLATILYSFLLFSFPQTLQAGDTLREVELQPVDIHDSLIHSKWQGHFIVTGNKRPSTDLGELLHLYTPAHIRGYGIGSTSSIALRGMSAAQTQILWNGINLNSPSHGQADLSLFPAFFFDEVHVLYGSNSLQDGTGGIGGNVKLRNDKLTHKGWSGRLEQSFGSFNNHVSGQQIAYAGENISSRFRVFQQMAENNFSFQNISKTGSPEELMRNADFIRRGVMQEITATIRPNTSLYTNVWIMENDRNLPRPMTVESNDERQLDRNFRSLSRLVHQAYYLKWEGFAAHTRDYMLYENKPAGIYAETWVNEWFGGTKISGQSGDLKWNSGIRYRGASALADGYPEKHRRDQLFLEAGAQFSVSPALSLNGIVHQEMVNNEIYTPLPSIGLKWILLEEFPALTLNAQASMNRRLPSMNDLYWVPGGNPGLQPEESSQAELALVHKYKFNKLQFQNETQVFYTRAENWILWQPATGSLFEATNINQVHARGIENYFTAGYIRSNLDFRLNLVYSHTLTQRPESNKQLIFLPKNQLKAHSTIKYNTWFVNGESTYTGKQFIDSENNTYLPAYELFHAALGKTFQQPGTEFQLVFRVRNMLDKQYQAIAWRPMPGRHWEVSLKIQFSEATK